MEAYEIDPLIRRIIREEIAHAGMGRIVETTGAYRASLKRFLNDPPHQNMRLIQPYGLASRPLPTMEAMILPVGGDPTHINVVGQNDTQRPATDPGEVCLYSQYGQKVYLQKNGKLLIDAVTGIDETTAGKHTITATAGIEHSATGKAKLTGTAGVEISGLTVKVGSSGANEPEVLGNVLLSAMDALYTLVGSVISAISTGPVGVIGVPAPLEPVPTNPALTGLLAVQQALLETQRTLYLTSPLTNIASLKCFTERGP